jgi:hypothetical protein
MRAPVSIAALAGWSWLVVGCTDAVGPEPRDGGAETDAPGAIDARPASSGDVGPPTGDASHAIDGGGDPAPSAIDCAAVPCRYVREGATGTGSGSDWADAYPALPELLERGVTYLVADGRYGSQVFDDPLSGDLVITLRKATIADHGTDVGWSDEHGDGQAEFADMIFRAGRYVIDGRTRDEDDWTDVEAYGFRNTGSVWASALDPGPTCADDLTVRYLDIGGPAIGNVYDEDNPSAAFYLGGFGDSCDRWTIQSCHLHNVEIPIMIAGGDDGLIERSFIGPAWQKEAIRGQIRSSRFVIRHNVFVDSCQFTPGDGGSGCTAEIAMWGEDREGAFSGNEIYGNVFRKTTDEHNSGGVIVVGGDGVGWVGAPASDTRIYNNTFVGFQRGTAMVLVNGGSGNEVRNNLWFDIGGGVATGCSAETCSHHEVVSDATLFVDAASGDFRLSRATSAGALLAAPYDRDLDGVVRGADGVVDLGAFEHPR